MLNVIDVHATPAVASEFLAKARLSCRKQWEIQYPWVTHCTVQMITHGMFCKLCQQCIIGGPPQRIINIINIY